MNADLELKLIDCLSALDEGQSIDQVLARYPAEAADLRPILETARALPAFRMEPSEAQKIKSRTAFLNQAADLLRRSSRPRATGVFPRLLSTFAAMLLIFIVLGGGAVAASGSALPGDPLYGLKRTVENVRLGLTASNPVRTALQAEFEQERRVEASALLDAGREAEVEFRGPIESIQPNAWVVTGLVVRIESGTQIVGQPQIDQIAEVHGRTSRAGLIAQTITIDNGQTPGPTPEPTSTPEPEPTRRPTPQNTPGPTEPRPTREPPPTTTPAPAPTKAPTAEPVEIEFTGAVDNMGAQTWTIDGATVEVDGNTEVRGTISVGQRVKVSAVRFADGRLLARTIELVDSGGGSGGGSTGGNSNHNNNDNQNGNDNHNQNENGNHNQNENDNANRNDNRNQNENSNQNHNGNGNGDSLSR